MDALFKNQSPELRDFYAVLREYIPMKWLNPILSAPFPSVADEVLFILRRRAGGELF
jgi:hypothetical protein